MDEDLFQILSHPFSAGGIAIPDDSNDDIETVLERKAAVYLTGNKQHTGESDVDIPRQFAEFKNEPDSFLHKHLDLFEQIRSLFFSSDLTDEEKTAISSAAPELESRLNEIKKFYKIYILTATNESLEKESYRLERKFFDGTGKKNQIAFIKMKRYFEKLRTFNEFARNIWRDIFKNLDSLELHSELHRLKGTIPPESRNEIYPLIRKTDSFLDSFKRYLEISTEEYDALTRSFRVEIDFRPGKVYSIPAFFGEESAQESVATEPSSTNETEVAPGERPPEEFQGSIARSIILETREHKLAGSRILSVPILGSRDWNRTPEYRLEIVLDEYESSMETFRSAYNVSVPEMAGKLPSNQNTILSRKGHGARYQQSYSAMIQSLLNETRESLIETDYPGLDHPEVFLYHTGPQVFKRILLATFRQRSLGEIYHMSNKNITHEFPLPVIIKEIIFWWNGLFKNLDGELVDSYLIFSRIIEMIKKDYRILYEEGARQRKRDYPGAGYSGLDRWIRENRIRIFGLRKLEVFRRFIPDNQTVDEAEREDILSKIYKGREQDE